MLRVPSGCMPANMPPAGAARQLVQACDVQRRPLALAEDRRIHGEKAHHAVDEQAQEARVEELARTGKTMRWASPRRTSSAITTYRSKKLR